MEKLGIVVDTISDDFEYAIDRVVEWGVPNIELFSLWGKNVVDLDDAELHRAAEKIERSQLVVTNLATLIMRCPPTDEATQQDLEKFKRATKIGKLFGTNRIRCYAYLKQPNFGEVRGRVVKTLRMLAELADKEGVTLLLENSSYANVQHASETRALLDEVDHPRLKLLWDPGNAFALGDPTPTVEAWRLLREDIAHLHIKDSVAHGSNEWVPVGSGALNLAGLLGALKSDGYEGGISLEPYFDDLSLREPWVKESVVALKAAMEGVGLGSNDSRV